MNGDTRSDGVNGVNGSYDTGWQLLYAVGAAGFARAIVSGVTPAPGPPIEYPAFTPDAALLP